MTHDGQARVLPLRHAPVLFTRRYLLTAGVQRKARFSVLALVYHLLQGVAYTGKARVLPSRVRHAPFMLIVVLA